MLPGRRWIDLCEGYRVRPAGRSTVRPAVYMHYRLLRPFSLFSAAQCFAIQTGQNNGNNASFQGQKKNKPIK